MLEPKVSRSYFGSLCIFTSSSCLLLKNQPQAELDDSVILRLRNYSERQRDTHISAQTGRHAELRMVVQIEELCPTLELARFWETCLCQHGKVEVVLTWPSNDSAGGVSKSTQPRRGKAGSVEPPLTCPPIAWQVAVAQAIGTLVRGEGSGTIAALAHRQGKPGLDLIDAGNLPAFQNLLRKSVYPAQKAASGAEREVIDGAEGSAMANIEIRVAAFPAHIVVVHHEKIVAAAVSFTRRIVDGMPKGISAN